MTEKKDIGIYEPGLTQVVFTANDKYEYKGIIKNRKTWALRSLKLHRTIQIVIRYWRSLVPISTGTTHDRVPKRNCGINKGGPSLVSKDVVSNRLFCNMANHFKMSKITS